MEQEEIGKEEIAYHEAGHAVINYRLGLYSYRVTIEPGELALGLHEGEGEWGEDADNAAHCAIRSFAGFAAQVRFNPEADRARSRSDDDRATELLLDYPELVRSKLEEKAISLVSEHWNEITAVALALLETQTLDGDQVSTICEAIENGADWREWLNHRRHLREMAAQIHSR